MAEIRNYEYVRKHIHIEENLAKVIVKYHNGRLDAITLATRTSSLGSLEGSPPYHDKCDLSLRTIPDVIKVLETVKNKALLEGLEV